MEHKIYGGYVCTQSRSEGKGYIIIIAILHPNFASYLCLSHVIEAESNVIRWVEIQTPDRFPRNNSLIIPITS